MSENKKETTVAAVEGFFIVTLRYRHINYYLVDPKLTISLDRSSAMIFVDEELAIDYATKVENAFKKIMNSKVLGYTETFTNIILI
jgi:hypothetical protein